MYVVHPVRFNADNDVVYIYTVAIYSYIRVSKQVIINIIYEFTYYYY